MKIIKQFQKHLSLFLYNNFDKFYMRPAIECVRNNNSKGLQLIGVEIGADRGYHSANIIRMLNIDKLYLIDCFVEDALYGSGSERLLELENRLYKYKDKYVLINGYSQEVSDKVPEYVDFVYIDGGHDYDTVMSDCRLYYPKVPVGGVFGGHDYEKLDNTVSRAVKDFLTGIDRFSDLNTSKRRDWWIIKR